jgi:hypothetical protein
VLTRTVFQTKIRCEVVTGRKKTPVQLDYDLPDVPALPNTLLLLDLVTQERCVDLHEMSQIVLSDVGATLQILRLAGREYGNEAGRLTRVEDCIADLGVQPCLSAVGAKIAYGSHGRNAVRALWSHSREIAQRTSMLAEEMPGVDPAMAYLAGLLHAIGSLPQALGWTWTDPDMEAASIARDMAMRWSLPECIQELFSETASSATGLGHLVSLAHRNAGRGRSSHAGTFL